MSSSDANLGVYIERPSSAQSPSGWQIVAISGFGCDFSVVWWVSVSSWKTVLTGGILKSVCRVWFVTYRGAVVICRRDFAWYRWITVKLEAAVQPHIASPYAHIDFRTILWMRILLVSESGERLPMSQIISRVLRSKCFLVLLYVFSRWGVCRNGGQDICLFLSVVWYLEWWGLVGRFPSVEFHM
jgi:hypothetical protein